MHTKTVRLRLYTEYVQCEAMQAATMNQISGIDAEREMPIQVDCNGKPDDFLSIFGLY